MKKTIKKHEPFQVGFTVSPNELGPIETVFTFSATTSMDTLSPTCYWDFGDGWSYVGPESTVQYSYKKTGTYRTGLTVTIKDEQGSYISSAPSAEITITDSPSKKGRTL